MIWNSIPEHIVKQYQSYCAETGFSSPSSRSSLCRILDVCSASTRTSLEGLDYFSAEGSKAFDDVVAIVDKLGDIYELGLTWSKEKIGKLKLVKRYLKGDYKVSAIKRKMMRKWLRTVIYVCNTSSTLPQNSCIVYYRLLFTVLTDKPDGKPHLSNIHFLFQDYYKMMY